MSRVSAALSQVEREAAAAEEEEKEKREGKKKEVVAAAGPSAEVDLDGDQDRQDLGEEEQDVPESSHANHSSTTGGGDDNTYALLVECNALAVDVDAEVEKIAAFLRLCYRPRFP